jgi:lipopolysaccharide transport system ATP-binding protein
MSETVIQIDNLWKKYRLGVLSTRVLAHDLNRWWCRVRRKPDPYLKVGNLPAGDVNPYDPIVENAPNAPCETASDEVWALRGVNLKVKGGEVLGVIGRNGAGKSTLLKILSRVTSPTFGEIRIKGRVASLLEVGTGFHPELTGRQNIYLNGSILGMTRPEINKKLDQIIDFANIPKYIDTPVKRYSSGMYVRLAFAVAAHLDPEILIIDEVLAVGDAGFQKKCLGKMEDVARQGRAVLFVSHNMAAIQNLCSNGIVLKEGGIAFQGNASESISFYHRSVVSGLTEVDLINRKDRSGTGALRFTRIVFLDSIYSPVHTLTCGKPTKIRLHYTTTKPLTNVAAAIAFGSHAGENKILLWTELLKANYPSVSGEGYFECNIPRLPLFPGTYLITLFSQSGPEILDWIREADLVVVREGDFYGIGNLIGPGHQSVLVEHTWS